METTIEKIKRLKFMRKMTNAELSEKSGVPVGTLNKILSSSTKSVKTETLTAIAAALGADPVELVCGEKEDGCSFRGDSFGYVRVAAATPAVVLGDEGKTVSAIEECILKAVRDGANVLCLPELTVSGYTLSDLFYMEKTLVASERILLKIADFTKDIELFLFIGAPLRKTGRIYNCAVAICKGKILGVTPKTFIPEYNEFYESRQFCPAEDSMSEITIGADDYPFGNRIIYVNKSVRTMTLAAEICEDLWVADSPSVAYTKAGANMICNLSASDECVGKSSYRRDLVSMQSAKCVCAYVYADAGMGESSTDLVFSGHNLIAENGKILSESKPFGRGYCVADVDLSFIEYEKTRTRAYRSDESGFVYVAFRLGCASDGTLRKYERTPFIPSDKAELDSRTELILNIQSAGLMRRISHIGCKTVVIGVSGGLDSTLALLVACKAMDGLDRPRKDVIAVTMPCFGTTSRTKNNSVMLSEALGVTLKEIDISATVRSHFKDIGQSESNRDVTYENSQARERTQVIMDIANMYGGIVIGTGDLSELALGWATYNGDHMSMYGVNSSVPKTLVRFIVGNYAERADEKLKMILKDILDTPVSPELLPADENEKIVQKTEDIVGPYVLHDFFLYHFVRNGFSPEKILEIAVRAFDGEYGREEIAKWLKKFVTRFFSQQFKRSCLPDGVKVGSVSLSPRGDWRMPSDISCSIWYDGLDK